MCSSFCLSAARPCLLRESSGRRMDVHEQRLCSARCCFVVVVVFGGGFIMSSFFTHVSFLFLKGFFFLSALSHTHSLSLSLTHTEVSLSLARCGGQAVNEPRAHVLCACPDRWLIRKLISAARHLPVRGGGGGGSEASGWARDGWWDVGCLLTPIMTDHWSTARVVTFLVSSF